MSYIQGIEAVKRAKKRLGAPYRFGAELQPYDDYKKPIDCSELVQTAFAEAGLKIPDGSYHQYAACFKCSKAEAANIPGALCFWRKDKNSAISHVGISTGQGNVIEANGGIGKVVVRHINDFKWTEFGLPKCIYGVI